VSSVPHAAAAAAGRGGGRGRRARRQAAAGRARGRAGRRAGRRARRARRGAGRRAAGRARGAARAGAPPARRRRRPWPRRPLPRRTACIMPCLPMAGLLCAALKDARLRLALQPAGLASRHSGEAVVRLLAARSEAGARQPRAWYSGQGAQARSRVWAAARRRAH